MRILESIYRSPMGRLLSLLASSLARFHQPFMVYGYRDLPTGNFRKYTRMSSTVVIMNRPKLSVADFVWVWHSTILDATEGLTIGEGCQIGAWVGIFTHGSDSSIRLLGKNFVNIPNTERKGYTRGAVYVGDYSFIGAGSVILPGVKIGKGSMISAGTLLTKSVPDYSIVTGNPAQVRGTTIDYDLQFFEKEDYSLSYYDPQALKIIQEIIKYIEDILNEKRRISR